MNNTTRLINLEYLKTFTKGDAGKMSKYIEMYLKNTPDVIREFQKEYDVKNYENLRLKAHSIKPQAKYFGISVLEKILLDIESIIRNNEDMNKLQPLIEKAAQINDEIIAEFNMILATR